MTREIKFRSWNEKEKVMYQNVESTYDYTNMYSPDNVPATCFGELVKDDKFVVMQYTGLKDKNGKEIYEGDIILGDYWSFGTKKREQFTVEWEEESAGFNLKRIEDKEIIGNIYENKDLLV